MHRELLRRSLSSPRPITVSRGFKDDDIVPMSPTDQLLSPTTQAIRRMHSPERRPSVDEEVDDAPRFAIHKHVQPRIQLTSLPLVLSSDAAHAWSVFAALQWDCTRMALPRVDPLPAGADAKAHLLHLAETSARALLLEMQHSPEDDQACVLITSHQLCVSGDEVRDIPLSRCQASTWLNGYSDSSVKILTCISVTNTDTGATATAVDEAVIRWRHIPEDVVDRVVRKGAVYQCAGAVDVLERDLNIYIADIEGSVDVAYGMPVKGLTQAMKTVLEGRPSF